MTSQPGTYVLLLHCAVRKTIQVGRLGSLKTQPGYYLYIGSAFGSGGLAARIRHHLQPAARPHWHIDYLRQISCLEMCWYTCDPQKREHDWAKVIAALPDALLPMQGFGSSDCNCLTHLVFFHYPPQIDLFRRHLLTRCPDHQQIHAEVMRSVKQQ